MSSPHALCCLPSVNKQRHDFHFHFFHSMYNKTILLDEVFGVEEHNVKNVLRTLFDEVVVISMVINKLLDEVFVISRITKVSEGLTASA